MTELLCFQLLTLTGTTLQKAAYEVWVSEAEKEDNRPVWRRKLTLEVVELGCGTQAVPKDDRTVWLCNIGTKPIKAQALSRPNFTSYFLLRRFQGALSSLFCFVTAWHWVYHKAAGQARVWQAPPSRKGLVEQKRQPWRESDWRLMGPGRLSIQSRDYPCGFRTQNWKDRFSESD